MSNIECGLFRGRYGTENTKPHFHENLLLNFNCFGIEYKIWKCVLLKGQWIHKLEIFILKTGFGRISYCKAFLFESETGIFFLMISLSLHKDFLHTNDKAYKATMKIIFLSLFLPSLLCMKLRENVHPSLVKRGNRLQSLVRLLLGFFWLYRKWSSVFGG